MSIILPFNVSVYTDRTSGITPQQLLEQESPATGGNRLLLQQLLLTAQQPACSVCTPMHYHDSQILPACLPACLLLAELLLVCGRPWSTHTKSWQLSSQQQLLKRLAVAARCYQFLLQQLLSCDARCTISVYRKADREGRWT